MTIEDLTENEMQTYKWLVRSTKRIKRLSYLEDPKTKTQLAEKVEVEHGTISDQVNKMRERNLVKPLNPEDNKGILYQQTDKANKLLNQING